MWLYILRKISSALLTMLVAVTLICSIIYLAPVDPARLTFGQTANNATLQKKRASLGLDQPLYIQLTQYLADLLPVQYIDTTDPRLKNYQYVALASFAGRMLIVKLPYLRQSYQSGRPVAQLLYEAIPRTLILAFVAFIPALLLGIALGIVAALYRGSVFDHLAVVTAVLGYSLPSYIAAVLTALLFGYYLAPYTGLNLQGNLFAIDSYGTEYIAWNNLILPALALAMRPLGLITQLTRTALLEVLAEDYIRTARSKGLAPRVVLLKHALRPALNPLVTASTGWFAGLLTGSFFIESVFNYNGVGWLTVNALSNFDTPVVLGGVLFSVLVFSVFSMFADVLYVLIDPRVRIGA